MPVTFWTRAADGEFRISDVNDAACEFSGFTREQMLGSATGDLGGDGPRARREMRQAAMRDEPVVRDLPFVLPNGEVRHLHLEYVRIDEDHVLAFMNDMTVQKEVEARLAVTESRYRALVSSANQGLWLVDRDGRTTFANGKTGRMLGRSVRAIVGGNLLDYVDPRDRASVAGALECPRDTPEAFEARFRHADGRELLCLMSVSPMPGGKDTPATLCVLADMTALKRERDLRTAAERQFRRMVETASEGVWTGDREGRTTFANDAAARMVGVCPDEALGRPFSDFVVDVEDAERVRTQLVTGRAPVRGELRLVRADGTHVDVIASLSLLRDEDDEVTGSLALVTDVTQIRREQADLRESRERFSQVFEESPAGMVFIAAGHLARGRFLGANRAFAELLGYSDTDLLEHDIMSVTHPDDVEAERQLADELFEGRRAEYEIEKRFVRADGRNVWTRFRVHVLRDDRGAPLYGLGVAVDISAQKDASLFAAVTGARAAAVLSATDDAVFEIAPDGTITHANHAVLPMFGVEPRETLGRPVGEAIAPAEAREELDGLIADWFHSAGGDAHAERAELMLARSDGGEFHAHLTAALVDGAGPPRMVLCVRNLGMQERADVGRRQAEERFERLFRDAQAAAAVVDLRGSITDANPAFTKLTGQSREELAGRDAAEVLRDAGETVDPPWKGSVERQGPQAAARRVERQDGRSITVHVSCSLVRDATGAPLHWICQCMPHLLADGGTLPDGEPLTYRERQVLGLLARGHDGPAIAERLGLSPETVRSYANSARERLGAKTRTEAVALAIVRREIAL